MGSHRDELLKSFCEVPHNGDGQAPDFLDPDCFPSASVVPNLGSVPSDYFFTLGSAVLDSGNIDGFASVPSKLPADLASERESLSEYGQLTLHRLVRLPHTITVPVLDYPPGGLGKRMGYLLANALWYMNISLSKSDDCMTLYTLLFQLLPSLILHDTRQFSGEAGLHGETNRSTIMARLKLAESGSFVQLIEKFLHAIQLSHAKYPGHGVWEAQCERAAKASLAGGWRLAFRALEGFTALPRNQATFDKVKATYITQPLTDTSAGVLRSLCEEILRKSSDKTAKQLTVGMVVLTLTCAFYLKKSYCRLSLNSTLPSLTRHRQLLTYLHYLRGSCHNFNCRVTWVVSS